MSPNKTLSRRSFGRLLAAGPAASLPALPQAPSREQELQAAHQRRLAAAETLAKFEVPMATEPAFIFRP
jgi:hypothetical protein